MILAEVMDSAYEWKDKYTDDEYEATFKAGAREIVLDIERIPRDGSHWEMAFLEKRDDRTSLKITGSGQEFRVFATVVKIAKQFMEKHDVDSMSFTAEKSDGSRAKLYQKMVDRLIGSKWEQEADHKASDYRSYFTVKKKEA